MTCVEWKRKIALANVEVNGLRALHLKALFVNLFPILCPVLFLDLFLLIFQFVTCFDCLCNLL